MSLCHLKQSLSHKKQPVSGETYKVAEKRAGLYGYNTTLMLGAHRTVIKLSNIHSSITRYTNMLHKETESMHPILWCANICRERRTDCGRLVTG